MPRRLSDREFATLLAAEAGRLVQSRRTGRYTLRVRRGKDQSPNRAARVLRAGGLITLARPVDVPRGAVLIPVVPTRMGRLAIERESLERETESEGAA